MILAQRALRTPFSRALETHEATPIEIGMGDTREPLTATALYGAVLLAFALVVVILIFPVMAGLLLLLMLVVVVSVPMAAAAGVLERFHIPRGIAAPVLMLIAIAAIAGLFALLVPIFTGEGKRLLHSLPSLFDDVRRSLGGSSASSRSGHSLQQYVSGYTDHPQKLLGPAATVGAGVAGVVTSLVVIIITSLYIAIRPEPLERGLVRLFPPPKRGLVRHVMHRLADAYKGWLRGLAAGMLVLWAVTYVGLLAVGLPYAVVFATLTAVAMVVPYYGALTTSIPPILVALTISPGKALIVAAIYVLAHEVEGHIIGPLVMARAVELHPALVAAGVIAVERAFGPFGLVVAVPILASLKILTEELWVRPMEEKYGVDGEPGADGDTSAFRKPILASGPTRTARRRRTAP
jgi:predicted PurR-regulated permease PerM